MLESKLTDEELAEVHRNELREKVLAVEASARRRRAEKEAEAQEAQQAAEDSRRAEEELLERLEEERQRHRHVVALIEGEIEREREMAREAVAAFAAGAVEMERRHTAEAREEQKALAALRKEQKAETAREMVRRELRTADPPSAPPQPPPPPPSRPTISAVAALEARVAAAVCRNTHTPPPPLDPLLDEDYLRALFQQHDTDGSGALGKAEAENVFRDLAQQRGLRTPPLSELNKLLGRTDAMGVVRNTVRADNSIDFDEFCILMLWIVKQ